MTETSETLIWRELDAGMDATGVLGLPALMVQGASATEIQPSRRGAMFLRQFLCVKKVAPHPPMGLPAMPGASVRERLAAATASPECQGLPPRPGRRGRELRSIRRHRPISPGRPTQQLYQLHRRHGNLRPGGFYSATPLRIDAALLRSSRGG